MPRFRYGYDASIGDAMHLGYFHAVSAFNNAGFGLHADSLTRYSEDPWITLPIAAAVILGGIGFPVLLEVLRHRRRRRTTGRRNWTLHTRLTLITTALLLATGTVLTCLMEWTNAGGGAGWAILALVFLTCSLPVAPLCRPALRRTAAGSVRESSPA